MNISTKGKYALQLLTYLGVTVNSQRLTTLKEVALSEGLSEKYLWQVASQLKAAGLIKSVPGPRGGFVLSKAAATITLAEALLVFEPELFRAPGLPEVAQNSHPCATVEDKLREIDGKVEQILMAANIGELVDECRKRRSEDYAYQI